MSKSEVSRICSELDTVVSAQPGNGAACTSCATCWLRCRTAP